MSFNLIVGHPSQINLIKNLITKGTFPQSVIFSGTEGVGKKLIAETVLESLTGNKLNVRVLGEEKAPTIEEVREAISWLLTKPTEGKGKGLIIDRSDEMRSESANALLKTLEEPPPYAYIILIAKNENKLLPTIRSRCKTFRFGKLLPSNVKYILERKGIEPDEKILKMCGGSPGLALKLQESQVPSLVEEFIKVMKKDRKNFLKLALQFSNISKDEMELFLTAIESLFAEGEGVFKWMPIIQRAREMLHSNVKPQSIVEWMILSTLVK